MGGGMDDDDFLDDDDELGTVTDQVPHVMLVVDDEPGIHEVTRLALRSLNFAGRPLQIISAYSGQEAYALLGERDDVAVILLDVVMESETAGLDLVKAIRRDLGNTDVRIILRTGQPGQAPEETVIIDYDINDYKAKSELTRSHLMTSVISALRGWRDIQELHQYRRQAYAQVGRQSAIAAAILDLIPTPAAVLDTDGLIVAHNGALASLAGGENGDLVGYDLPGLGLGEVAVQLALGRGDGIVTSGGVSWQLTLRPLTTVDGVVDAVVMRLDPPGKAVL
jgi:CheY-like chemotaxis protein